MWIHLFLVLYWVREYWMFPFLLSILTASVTLDLEFLVFDVLPYPHVQHDGRELTWLMPISLVHYVGKGNILRSVSENQYAHTLFFFCFGTLKMYKILNETSDIYIKRTYIL